MSPDSQMALKESH